LKALAKRPEDRYSKVIDLVNSLTAAVAKHGSDLDKDTVMQDMPTVSEQVVPEPPQMETADPVPQAMIQSDLAGKQQSSRILTQRNLLFLLGGIVSIVALVWLFNSGIFSSNDRLDGISGEQAAAVSTEIPEATVDSEDVIVPPALLPSDTPTLAPTPSPEATEPPITPTPQGLILAMAYTELDFQIFTMNPDGSELSQLTFEGSNFEPQWSPDGNLIIFVSTRTGNREIYLMNADGSNHKKLTSNPGWDGFPDWSPDGSSIAYQSDKSGNQDIWLMNPDGSSQTNITSQHLSSEAYPNWSPNGNQLAFSSNRDGNEEIYIMNTDGSNPVRLTNRDLADYSPTWSTDGERICFNSNNEALDDYRIWSIDANGENLQEIGSYYGFCWFAPGGVSPQSISPSGFFKVYANRVGENFQLFMSSIDGPGEVRITYDELSWQVPLWQPVP
jgi:TolB protein